MKTLQGKLTITRPMNTRDDDYISITLNDTLSTCQAVEIRVSLAEFAKAITGMGHVDCVVDWNDSGIIGKRREFKRLEVFVPHFSHRHPEVVRAALVKHEVDGWEGRDSDAMNHHNWTRRTVPEGKDGHWTTVLFERWVDVEADETGGVP